MTMLSPPPRAVLLRMVQLALDEDAGRGDLTSASCIPSDAVGTAEFRARKPCVLAAFGVVELVFSEVDPGVRVTRSVDDGCALAAGAVIGRISGSARSLLLGERVALNFLQRASGVATATRAFVDALPPGSATRIADTRKTTPGLRALERYAVRCGGGFNHREDLSSAVLIKDNHVAAAGGVGAAIRAARANAPHTTRIECEVDSLEQLDEALEARADIVMLDNFDDASVEKAVARVNGAAVVEVSGGLTLDRVAKLASLGVDVLSVGALTHSVRAVDIGLDWVTP